LQWAEITAETSKRETTNSKSRGFVNKHNDRINMSQEEG